MIYYPVYIVSLILLSYRVYAGILEKHARLFLPLIVFAIIGSMIFIYEGANAALLVSVLIVFDLVAFAYGSRKGFLLSILAIAYIAYLSSMPAIYLAQAIFLGLIS